MIQCSTLWYSDVHSLYNVMVFNSFNTLKGSQGLWTGGYGGRYMT